MHRLAILMSVLAIVLLCCHNPVVCSDGSVNLPQIDSVVADSLAKNLKYEILTDSDYIVVADSLGVEASVIKAVVYVEAGPGLRGFWKPAKPIINFDLVMFKKFAAKRKVTLDGYKTSHPVVFASPDVVRYKSRQAAQYARLDAAMTIDSVAAIEGTFWGMFQIGGFNWRNCNCESRNDFVVKMSSSERDQLYLFAAFIQKCGLVRYLKAHNWAGFALRYNGPSYKQRAYDTKMARAYKKFATEWEATHVSSDKSDKKR